MKKPTLTQWITAQLGRRKLVMCADLAEELTERLGYQPSLMAVSRVLGRLGWTRVKLDGRIGYRKEDER